MGKSKYHSKFISHKEIREWLEKFVQNEDKCNDKLISFNVVSILPSVPKFCKCLFENGNKRWLRIDYVLEEIRKERRVETL